MKKKNWLIGICLALTAVCSAAAFSACAFPGGGVGNGGGLGSGEHIVPLPGPEEEGVRYDVYDEGTHARVIGYNGDLTNVVIESTYEGLPVTHILGHSFENCKSMTSLTIPSSVTTIDGWAFSGCDNLTSVAIPDSVEFIADYAFANCANLSNFSFGSGITGLGSGVLSSCPKLTEIAVPAGIESVPNEMFNECTGLTSVTLPDGIERIGEYAFANCSNLSSIDIPDSVVRLEERAFRFCTSLKSVVLPEILVAIGVNAFEQCTNLESVTMFENVREMDRSSFTGCDKLPLQTYDGAQYIGTADNPYFALLHYADRSITSCSVHENTRVIASGAFSSCGNLTQIYIGHGVTSIGQDVFSSCFNLEYIYYYGSVGNGEYIGIEAVLDVTLFKAHVYYYVEFEKDLPQDGGYYWHYDSNGNPIAW